MTAKSRPGWGRELAALLGLAFIARLPGLFTRPIWYDEALSLLYARESLPDLLAATLGSGGTAANVHPPTYFVALSLWQAVAGESIASARLFSILAGVLTVALVYLLCKGLFPSNALLPRLAGVLVALSPFQVHYSQEIRMYSWLAVFILAAAASWWRAAQTGKAGWWVLFAICAAAAQYTQSLAAFPLLALAILSLATRQPRIILGTVLSGAGAILLYLPWLVNLPAQLGKIQQGYWVQPPGVQQVFTLLLSYTTNLPLPGIWLPVGLFLTLVVFFTGLWAIYLSTRKSEKDNMAAVWLAGLAFLPPSLAFLVSQWIPIFIERAFLSSGVFFLGWLAWVFTRRNLPAPARISGLVFLIAGFLIGNFQHLAYRGFPYGPYQEAAAYLQNESQTGGIVIHSNKLSMVPTFYFSPSLPQVFLADPPGSPTDTFAAETQQVLGVVSVQDLETATQGKTTVWLVIFRQSIAEAQSAGLVTHPHITWLDENFNRVEEQPWGELLVIEYER